MKRFFAFLFTLCMLMALSGCIEQTDPYSITLAAADDNYVETTAETLPMEIVFDRLTVLIIERTRIVSSSNHNGSSSFVYIIVIINVEIRAGHQGQSCLLVVLVGNLDICRIIRRT